MTTEPTSTRMSSTTGLGWPDGPSVPVGVHHEVEALRSSSLGWPAASGPPPMFPVKHRPLQHPGLTRRRPLHQRRPPSRPPRRDAIPAAVSQGVVRVDLTPEEIASELPTPDDDTPLAQAAAQTPAGGR